MFLLASAWKDPGLNGRARGPIENEDMLLYSTTGRESAENGEGYLCGLWK